MTSRQAVNQLPITDTQKNKGYNAAYYAKNRVKRDAYRKDWALKNPEKDRLYKDKWSSENPSYVKPKKAGADAAYYQENKATIKARVRKWVSEHLAQYNAKQTARRALKLAAVPKWATKDSIQAFYEKAQALSRETGVVHHVDHIVPLQSKIVCGLHCADNLQVLIGSENCRKSNRSWPGMPN